MDKDYTAIINERAQHVFDVMAPRTTPEQLERIRAAFELAREAHSSQKRKTGEPYILHPIAVATIAAEELMLDANPVMAAFLHDVVDPRAEYVQMMVIGYGYALLHLKRYDEALQFQNIYEEFGGTADFVCLMGLIYLRKGMIVQAMAEFLKATTFETARTEGANSFIPIFNMGCINEVLGEREAAVSHYKRCGSFRPALDRLRELEDI